MQPPTAGNTWCGLSSDPLPLEEAYAWALRPDCGAVVVFTGTARDHSDGRPGVDLLEYEAYEEHVVPTLESVARDARERFTDISRIVLLHRTGPVALTEAAVVVAVSAPHRGDAFEAARFCIDTVKATAPIWKRERWSGGEDWALPCAADHAGAEHGAAGSQVTR